MSLVNQIRINLLSIISLVVALTALGYNTYRNELTEQNRTIRHAGFNLLVELNSLQLLVDNIYYGEKQEADRTIKGWSHVLYITDMGQLVSDNVMVLSIALRNVWKAEFDKLNRNEQSNIHITQAIKKLREAVLQRIRLLD